MASYYDSNKPTTANFPNIVIENAGEQHFPTEGLYIGKLSGGAIDIPALVDLTEVKGLTFLYNSEAARKRVNHVIEKLAWRIALTVPSNLCDIILYNGGNPGDAFNAHSRIDNYLMNERSERVFFDGDKEYFDSLISEIYSSMKMRAMAIHSSRKSSLVELNEALGKEARMKYQFVFLTDFPRHISPQTLEILQKIIEAGTRTGIYVIMSWDMQADFPDNKISSSEFNPQKLVEQMELIAPNGDGFRIVNSGHDEILSRFQFELDNAEISFIEEEKWLSYIQQQAKMVKENTKPTNIQQDYLTLEQTPYEPVLSEISIPVGLDINDKHPAVLRFSHKEFFHAFVLGKTGSGKSGLLNTIICSLLLKYSPEDLMLYLLDFKGVEFNRYRGIKHTKAVLVDNKDSRMALEVIDEMWEEFERRSRLFKADGVQHIADYNKLHPDARLPQVLFIADECQMMFQSGLRGTELDIQKNIEQLLANVAKLGRSHGFHIILATQELGSVDIPDSILNNLSEYFLMLSAPRDSDRLVPDSSLLTSRQTMGISCFYHNNTLQSQLKGFFAENEELNAVIESIKKKSANCKNNGAHYFCGSAKYYLDDIKDSFAFMLEDAICANVGQTIKVNSRTLTIPIRNDFYENILIMGVNKKEQACSVALNAMASMMIWYSAKQSTARFLVIDCLNQQGLRYKSILSDWKQLGNCEIIPRQSSGKVLSEIVESLKTKTAQPTVLTIIGAERFIEMKRKSKLSDAASDYIQEMEETDFSVGSLEVTPLDDTQEDSGPALNEADMEQYQQEIAKLKEAYKNGTLAEVQTETPAEEPEEQTVENITFPKALVFILEEGPLQGVHTILQVDKPQNILFEEYDMTAANKFNHKVLLRSENKNIVPLRFGQDIDVEALSDEEDALRAYYYPEGDDPVLFTPYQMPSRETACTLWLPNTPQNK